MSGTVAVDDKLSMLVEYFEDAEMTSAPARQDAERDRDYYDGDQLTPQERASLESRKQPALVINRIRRKIDYLQGLEKQSRQDPKAYPRNPDDGEAADAATDALRYVADAERFPQTASACWKEGLVEGAYGVDVCAEEGGPTGYRIRIKRIAWDRMFWDPHSRETDFSDAKYLGMVLWMDEADVLAKWPDAGEAVEISYASNTMSDTYDDKPRYNVWGDGKRKRVRVAQVYWNDAEAGWQYATFTKGGFLDEAGDSPYVDEDGKPTCGLILCSAYVDRDNNRYGAVRDMIGPQDEINKRRSKALHLLSVRQVRAEQGAVNDVDVARRELAKPDGYVETNPGFAFELLETNDLAAGQAQLLQEAKLELDGMGPNATMQGKQGGDPSGRAIALSQQGGLVEAGMLLDQHRDWKRRVYAAIWERVRQFWTAEIWVRVTDDENAPRFVGLNAPQTLAEALQAMDPQEAQAIAAQMGLAPGDPRLEQTVATKNKPAETMVDIVIDESPDVITLQVEQQQVIRDVMQAVPALAPALIEPFIRSTNLRNKDGILERIKEMMNQPQGDGGAGAQAAASQAETQAKIEADMAKTSAQQETERLKIAAQQDAEAQRIAAEDRRKAAELEMQWQIALLGHQAKAADAEAARSMDRERMQAEGQRADQDRADRQASEAAKAQQSVDHTETQNAHQKQLHDVLHQMMVKLDKIDAPREFVRGPDGKVAGLKVGDTIRPIARGPDGKAMGLQ